VRVLPNSFAVAFDGSFGTRITMIRSFYAGNYVKAIDKVAAAGVGRAIMARLLS